MTDAATPDLQPPEDAAAADAVLGGGGPSPAEQLANDPVYNAAAKLELLSEETRERVLERMDPAIAQRIRDHIASQPANRPHGTFSTDVATRKQLIQDMADRLAARRTAEAEQMAAELAPGAASTAMSAAADQLPPATMAMTPGGADHGALAASGMLGGQPAGPMHVPGAVQRSALEALDELRGVHPAAIARAMQGERAEAWAIVLDHLDDNARAALQLYLDPTARAAIDDARARQAELQATAPALLATVVTAIARTVVPRATREHHQLLSTTQLAWTVG